MADEFSDQYWQEKGYQSRQNAIDSGAYLRNENQGSTGGASTSFGGGSMPDLNSLLSQITSSSQQAMQPLTQAYETGKTALEGRYKTIIDSIGKTASQELG